jgi:uncharacterized protein YjbI with pentapeptide repeats
MKTKPSVFIGHGHSAAWRALVPLVESQGFAHEEFNAHPVAGQTAQARLDALLSKSSYAVLVLTAEDERSDGSLQARSNVVHEAGLFQGRLGFRHAIMLIEEGCATFSNIDGLMTIRFQRGDIRSAFVELRRLLEEWHRVAGAPARGQALAPRPRNAPKPRYTGLGRPAVPTIVVSTLLLILVTVAAVERPEPQHHLWVYGAFLVAILFPVRWLLNRQHEVGRGRALVRQYKAGDRAFAGLELTRALLEKQDLVGCDLSSSVLYRAALSRSALDDCRFRGADLREAELEHTEANAADFTEAVLTGAYFRYAKLKGAVFNRATLMDARAAHAVLDGASFRGANARGANLFSAKMSGADLEEAVLSPVVLADAELQNANLRYADLRGADLSGANLRGANLTGADVEKADLSGADLTGADTTGCDLSRAYR